MSRAFPWGCLACALYLLEAASLRHEAAAQDAPLRVTYRFDRPQVQHGKDGDRLTIPGLTSWGLPGEPILPRRLARILLPPGARLESIAVRPSEPIRLPGLCRLAPAPAECSPIDGKRTADTRAQVPLAPEELGARDVFPEQPWVIHGVGLKHGRAVALVTLSPVRYRPASGEALFHESIDVEVRLRRPVDALGGGAAAPVQARPDLEEEVAAFVDNPEAARGGGGGAAAAEQVRYAIITSPALAPAFEPLAAARTAGGLEARVFTTDWIYAHFDGRRPDGGTDDATRIRNFIADAYASLGLTYVLLGGDADGNASCSECGPVIVPTRYLQTNALASSAIPADMYYGCLDGTFDGDGDGIYGETNDGVDGGDVDFLFEVHVGRAPVDSLEEARNFVRKTLAYEASSGPVLRKVLFVGEHLGFGGDYDWGDNLDNQILSGSDLFFKTVGFQNSPYADFFELSTLYDRDWPGQNWPPSELISRLERGVHIVNHVGHADISNVMKLTNADVDALRGDDYFLGYTQSCFAGAFDNQRANGEYGSDSIIEHFLTGPSGAVAFIASSRRGWASTGSADGPSQRFNRRFWDTVFRLGVLQWGAANDRSKEESLDYIAANVRARSCAFELNTLGDPALTMRFASQRGSVSFDRTSYSPGETAAVTVIDSGLDLSPVELDRASVRMKASGSGDAVAVEVIESGVSSGIFRGQVVLAEGAAAADAILQVKTPDTITCEYEDADAGGGQRVTAQASALATAPLRIESPCPGDGAIGVPYERRITAAGGLPPYSFSSETGYVEELGEATFEGLGVPQGWSTDEGAWRYALPFEFPFYGQRHPSVLVSANGYLELGSGNGLDFANSANALINGARIAPLWADLVTTYGDVYIDEKLDSVTFRWLGRGYHTGDGINVEAELFSDGTIRFGYGNGDSGLSPTIGISAGDGERYLFSALSGRDDLAGAPSVRFFPTRLPDGLEVDAATGDISGSPAEVTANDVSFAVEDSLGQRARQRCFVSIRPDGLVFESPSAGDLWLRASEQTIRWQWFGSAGSRVRLDYNLTGSATVFPSAITADAALSVRALQWTPPNVAAPAARLRLRSVEKPDLFTVSGVFSLVGPTIILAAPAGGERWVAGTQAVVRWQTLGATGPRVQIRYNTTGESGGREKFPLVLASDAPNTGSFQLAVPATPSESCRLLVESLADSTVRAVSPGVFSIRPPSITLVSPNGGECLRTGEKASATWSSEGETGDQVVLEVNTSGGEGAWLPVGGGPLPNTGSAEWRVPLEPNPAALLRIRSVTDARYSDASDGSFQLAPRCGLRVLAWIPYIDFAEQQVIGVRQAFERADPGARLTFSTTTAPGALRVELGDKDALIVLKQKQGIGVDFDALGKSIAGVVTEFLEAGGAVVFCEQVPGSEPLLRALALMDFEALGQASGLCEAARPEHPILAGVRPNFSGPVNTSFYKVSGPGIDRLVTVSLDGALDGAAEGTVVAARDLGFGRLAFLGFDYLNLNGDTARILANAARLPFTRDGIRLTGPGPGAAFREGGEILVSWIARGAAQGPVRLAYNLTGASADFPFTIAEAAPDGARGSYRWTAPVVPESSTYLTVRIEARSIAMPESEDVLGSPIFVIRPLHVTTASLPSASVGLAYRARLEAGGGVPPYAFSISNLPAGLIVERAGDAAAEIAGTPQDGCPACEVTIEVADSIGLTATRSIALPVFLRRLSLVRPNGGELWLFGSSQEVQWTATSDIGETVSVRFNTDGSPTHFPQVIAESAAIAEPFFWSLPPVTAASCRLKVASNEHPEFFAISKRTFSIVGPTIRVDVPNGGECWQPGKVKTILWSSAGNGGGAVRIEYSTDGSTASSPRLIAEAAPDTGSYEWMVAEPLSDDCRVRVSFNNAPEVEDLSDAPFRIHTACRLNGLLWSPCPGTDKHIETIQDALREREPDWDAEASFTREPSALGPLLANRDVLIVLLESLCITSDQEDLGRKIRPELEAFTGAGGVVIFCGPTPISSVLLRGLGLLDEKLVIAAAQGSLACAVASLIHPITRGVPLRFDGPFVTSAYRKIGPGFETLISARGLPVAAARDEGAGRWVLLGFDFSESNEASGRILANAARQRPVTPGMRILSPPPGAVFAAGDGIPIEWAARGGRSGAIRISFNTDGSTSAFPGLVGETSGDASGGRFEWTAPAPLAGPSFASRLEIRWVEPPELPAASEAPFHVVVKPLSIETDALAEGFQLAEYFSDVSAAGGVPPYVFEAVNLPAGLALPSPEPGSRASGIEGRPLETGSDRVVTLRVRDFLGSEVTRSVRLNVFPSRIEILSPVGGEYLLAGAPFEVRWRVHGFAGETLRVEFNTNGSPKVFPELAGESVPVDSSLTWIVPAAESDACRLRIKSNEIGLSAASERTFAISPPRITCLSPNGSEALETETVRTIRWRSLGNAGGKVRIDLSLDGSMKGFDASRIAVAEEAPDTGRFEWTVPAIVSETCRLRVESVSDLSLVDYSDGVFAILHRSPVRGLVWVPYTGFQRAEVRGAIAAATLFENDFDWVLSKALTPEALESELAGKETFLVVEQEPAPQVNFKASGRALGPVLESFVLKGGTVVVLKQSGNARELLPATGLLHPAEAGRALDAQCRVVLPLHPVVNQVPEAFSSRAATAWYDLEDEDAQIYAVAADGKAVAAGRDLGDGRVVLIGFDYRDYTDASARLLANAVRMTPDTERPFFVRGDANASGRVDVADAIFILSYLFHGGREPPCLDAADVDDSSQPGHPRPAVDLNDATFLLRWLFTGGPTPPAPEPRWTPPQTCGPDRQFRDGLGCASFPPCASP